MLFPAQFSAGSGIAPEQVEVRMEARKTVKLSSWRLPIGRISRKGLN